VATGRRLAAARAIGVLFAAVPGVGLGGATLWQAALEGAAASQNQMFHLALGLALLVLFCEFAVLVSRAGSVSGALLRGAAGFAACLAGALAGELLGPLALVVLVAVASLWAVRLAVRRPETGVVTPPGRLRAGSRPPA
jgi:hypothetical protein